MPEPVAVVTVAEMRALEAAAIAAGTPERVLQERAGLAVADVIEADLAARPAGGQPARPARIVVLAGSGNNGRDAVVAGRRLQARGCSVEIWHGSRNPLSATEVEDIVAEGICIQRYDGDRSAQHLEVALGSADITIDGLLGVGQSWPDAA